MENTKIVTGCNDCPLYSEKQIFEATETELYEVNKLFGIKKKTSNDYIAIGVVSAAFKRLKQGSITVEMKEK